MNFEIFGDKILINWNSSLTIANLTFDIVGQLNHTNVEWEVPEISVNFTISGISGGFDNLTDNFFNELLNLSGPEILELAWPGLQPTVEGLIAGVSIFYVANKFFSCLMMCYREQMENFTESDALSSRW